MTQVKTQVIDKKKINKKTLHIVLIKPSKYDDEGYVIQYKKGVMPSNTISVLYGLTLKVAESDYLPPSTKIKVDLIDEIVTRINIKKLVNMSKKKNKKLLVCLCGVQTNQFARSSDIALKLSAQGVTVIIGGFHISGSIAVFNKMSPELKELYEKGVSLVAGEVEETWKDILNDFMKDELKLLYNFLDKKPQLAFCSLPDVHKKYQKKYFLTGYATMDLGRGCPFNCTFCCIINVQGRKMRFRNIDGLKEIIRYNFYKNRIKNYFFTDDNFSRNKNWEQILDILIELRENERIPLGFMIQIDTKAYEIKNFIEKCGRAGCTQAFIGVESLNPNNLVDVGKVQNNVEKFKEMNEKLLRHSIATHAAYIIGFPNDTEESIREDIKNLINVGFSQASFFILTPLPGSMDHKAIIEKGIPLDADYNNYDTFNHQVMEHPNLKNGKLIEMYKEAWNSFLSVENIKNILIKANPDKYYAVLGGLLWYKHSIVVDEMHPMVSGAKRLKYRKDRRPIFKMEPFFPFHLKKIRDKFSRLSKNIALIREFEEIWLQTRPRTKIEEKIVSELKKLKAGLKKRIRFKEIKAAIKQAKIKKYSFQFRYFLKKLFLPFLMPIDEKLLYTRKFLNNFWVKTRSKLKRGKIFSINIFKLVYNTFSEIQLALKFGLFLLKSAKKNKALLKNFTKGLKNIA